MLFRRPVLERIASGEVTLAFRRWRRPTVRSGGTLRTAVGVLAIETVEAIVPDDITLADARCAGYPSAEEVHHDLASQPGDVYRIAFRLEGEDPRIVLRERADLSADDRRALDQRLARLDRTSRHGRRRGTCSARSRITRG